MLAKPENESETTNKHPPYFLVQIPDLTSFDGSLGYGSLQKINLFLSKLLWPVHYHSSRINLKHYASQLSFRFLPITP